MGGSCSPPLAPAPESHWTCSSDGYASSGVAMEIGDQMEPFSNHVLHCQADQELTNRPKAGRCIPLRYYPVSLISFVDHIRPLILLMQAQNVYSKK